MESKALPPDLLLACTCISLILSPPPPPPVFFFGGGGGFTFDLSTFGELGVVTMVAGALCGMAGGGRALAVLWGGMVERGGGSGPDGVGTSEGRSSYRSSWGALSAGSSS